MLKKELPKIRAEEMWMMNSYHAREYALNETRAKIVKVGKITDECLDGVEFYFTDKVHENFCMGREEFLTKFEKVY